MMNKYVLVSLLVTLMASSAISLELGDVFKSMSDGLNNFKDTIENSACMFKNYDKIKDCGTQVKEYDSRGKIESNEVKV